MSVQMISVYRIVFYSLKLNMNVRFLFINFIATNFIVYYSSLISRFKNCQINECNEENKFLINYKIA